MDLLPKVQAWRHDGGVTHTARIHKAVSEIAADDWDRRGGAARAQPRRAASIAVWKSAKFMFE